MSSIIDDDLIQLLTEQSDLYHSQNAEKWKVSPKTLKWSNSTPEKNEKVLATNDFYGTRQKGKCKRLLVH